MPSIAGMLSSIGPTRVATRLGAELDGALEGRGRVLDAERHGARRRTVLLREALAEAARLGVDDEVDVALPVQRDVLAAMPRDHREAQPLEQRAQQLRIGRGVFDELEAVGAHGIVADGIRAMTGLRTEEWLQLKLFNPGNQCAAPK